MSPPDIVGALQASSSAEYQTRVYAEQQLKEWAANSPQFYEALLQVVGWQQQAPLEARIQAVLLFKNDLDRWRKTCPKSVPGSTCGKRQTYLLWTVPFLRNPKPS